ncbi:MAG: twin-arginine translocase subunit TatC [Planctomycetes bacterium]|nr:twin-arginine translocase subunit TatC [Planctomycetota bacterium]
MNERRLTFGEHLEELRYRIIISLVAVLVAFVFCWVFRIPLMNVLAAPHQKTMRAMGFSPDLKITAYQEAFITLMKVCFISALFISSPVVIYEMWMFVAAGLYEHEKRYVYIFAPISLGSFLLGMLFGYFILIPFGLRFLLMVVGDIASPIIKISDYVSLLMLLTLVLGIVFQLPLVLLFLVKIDLITPETLRRERRYAILAAFIIAAILTPPDPGTQMMLAIPTIALYEIGILIAAFSWGHFFKLTGAVVAALAIGLGLVWHSRVKASQAGGLTEGSATIEQSARSGPRTLRQGEALKVGHIVRTGQDSKAALRLASGCELRMNTNTDIRFTARNSLRLVKGEIWIAVKKENYIVRTPDCGIDIKPGETDVAVNDAGTTVIVGKGVSAVTTRDGAQHTIMEGRKLTVKYGGKPTDIKAATSWTKEITKPNPPPGKQTK